jgi:hypothetical protein
MPIGVCRKCTQAGTVDETGECYGCRNIDVINTITREKHTEDLYGTSIKWKPKMKNTWVIYTEPEKKLLKQAVESGRSNGETNTEIAENLVKNGIFPGRTKGSLMMKMSAIAPKQRGGRHRITKNKERAGVGKDAYDRVEKLLERRKKLLKEKAKIDNKLLRVESRLQRTLR